MGVSEEAVNDLWATDWSIDEMARRNVELSWLVPDVHTRSSQHPGQLQGGADQRKNVDGAHAEDDDRREHVPNESWWLRGPRAARELCAAPRAEAGCPHGTR